MFSQVATHSFPDDCWVSIHGNVFNVTNVVLDSLGSWSHLLRKEAGTDISRWFVNCSAGNLDHMTANLDLSVKVNVDPVMNIHHPYFIDSSVLIDAPSTNVDTDAIVPIPWWEDESLIIGRLTSLARKVRLRNVLTGQEHILEVPKEEKVSGIRERYLEYNWHARSYTWKVLLKTCVVWKVHVDFIELDMNKTLDENDVLDDSEIFDELSVPSDFFTPVIHLYYNDDLSLR